MTKIEYTGSGELHVTGIQDARTMPKQDLDRVLTVCQDEISDNIPDNVTYSHYCMSDGCIRVENKYGGSCDYELFESAAIELQQALESNETVLIHCHAGQSRSVSVAAAALGRLLDKRFIDALGIIHTYRNVFAYPDEQLCEHGKKFTRECH
jgi:protein-tyrosine phosphatase